MTFDRELTFTSHTTNVCKEASGKLKLIAAVGNSKWGWRKQNLRKLYYAYIRSKLDYSGPGWQPWLSDQNINTLEATQNKALRIITGQLRSSPVEALRFEAGVGSYRTRIMRTTLRTAEKAKRLPPNHPCAVAWNSASRPRNHRSSFARLATELSESHIPLAAESRQPIPLISSPPWEQLSNVSIFSNLEGVKDKRASQESIRTAATKAIENWASDINIFTDGSAVEGCKSGGAAAVINVQADTQLSANVC